MTDLARRMLPGPTLSAPLALCAAAIFFGFSRDFGCFMLSLCVLPLLFLLALLCTAFVWTRPEPGRAALWASILIVVAPLLYLGVGANRDRIGFAGWAMLNGGILMEAPGRDGIVIDWASWGMAGSGNDAYLVADPGDAIGTIPAAEAWRKRHHFACEIVDTSRMWPRLYIVTTYNCPLDAIMAS
jgi:hypothetical protein